MSLLLLFGAGASSGTAGATTTTGASGRPVTAGREYEVYAEVRSAVTARNFQVGVEWFNSGGTSLGTQSGAIATDSASAWTTSSFEAVAPTGAAFASVFVWFFGCAAAEVHYVDKIGLMQPSVWSLPE